MMKRFIAWGSHLLASLFLFYFSGMALALLLTQSKWVDMRFDSEYVILASMICGLWFYFLVFYMEARSLMWWGKRKVALSILFGSMLIIVLTTVLRGALFIIPAISTRKAWFLESVFTIEQMNVVVVIWMIVGIASLLISWRHIPRPMKETSLKWNEMSGWTRSGMMSLFGILILLLLFYLAQGGFRYAINDAVTLLKQADVEVFRDYLVSFGFYAALISALLMILSNIIAPLPGFVITFTNGLVFGWLGGAALSWVSSMAGALLCFYLARYLGRPFTEKNVSRAALEWTDRFFARYGKHAILIARLLPFVSFDLVSYAAGLTSMRVWTFFWATGVGELPATLLYSYLGKSATGAVKILFILFTVVLVLAIIGAIFRPKLKKQIGMKREH
jgi:uncharacterized membrane protein YdjX (TVP38/TMEM64 family)